MNLLIVLITLLSMFALAHYIRKQISYGEHIRLHIEKARAEKSLTGLHHLKSRY